MATGNEWNSLEVAKLIVPLLIAVLVGYLGYLFNRRLREIELANQRRDQEHKEEQQRMQDEITRRYEPHIEFTISCNFFGPHQGFYIAEFVIFAKNVSLVQHRFKKITLRVRGIKSGETPALWEGYGNRLLFKHLLFKEDITPPEWNYIFVDPGITQQISYISRIPDDIHYIVAHAHFEYDQYTPHTIERMFEVTTTPGGRDQNTSRST